MDPKGGRARDGTLKGQEQHDTRGSGLQTTRQRPMLATGREQPWEQGYFFHI